MAGVGCTQTHNLSDMGLMMDHQRRGMSARGGRSIGG